MKIAYFTDTYHPEVNGIVTSISKSSEMLAKRGHKIIIFCPKYGRNDKCLKLHKNIQIVRSFSLPLMTYKDVRISWPNHLSILRKAAKFKPDIIHMHTPGPISGAAIICATILRKPLIGTFHTLVTEQLEYASLKNLPQAAKIKTLFRYMKNLTHILDRMPGTHKSHSKRMSWLGKKISSSKIRRTGISRNIRKIANKPGKISLALKQMLVWRLLKIAYSRCNLITAPSPRIVAELKKRKFGNNIKYISNGIDFTAFKRKNKYHNHKRIISVGRVSFEKNIDVAIRSMTTVIKRHPTATLTIVGDGPALASLKDLAEKIYLSKNIRFTGMMPYNRLTKWYSRSDIFVTASTMETQGLTILEAMRCGLPVVGVRKYAIPDWVKNNINGEIVPPGNHKKMGESISRMLSSKRLEKMGRTAYLTAKEHDLKKVINHVEEMYKSMNR